MFARAVLLLLALVPLAGTAGPASAAAVRAEARAVIQNGITVRSAAIAARPDIDAPGASIASTRDVLRPCRTGESEPTQRCRFLLLELQ
jgi:hypothetical protein